MITRNGDFDKTLTNYYNRIMFATQDNIYKVVQFISVTFLQLQVKYNMR